MHPILRRKHYLYEISESELAELVCLDIAETGIVDIPVHIQMNTIVNDDNNLTNCEKAVRLMHYMMLEQNYFKERQLVIQSGAMMEKLSDEQRLAIMSPYSPFFFKMTEFSKIENDDVFGCDIDSFIKDFQYRNIALLASKRYERLVFDWMNTAENVLKVVVDENATSAARIRYGSDAKPVCQVHMGLTLRGLPIEYVVHQDGLGNVSLDKKASNSNFKNFYEELLDALIVDKHFSQRIERCTNTITRVAHNLLRNGFHQDVEGSFDYEIASLRCERNNGRSI